MARSFVPAGIEIDSDDGVQGNETCDTEVMQGEEVIAPAAYVAYLDETVQSPKTPHPFSMSPPLPPGEPPRLLKNKRPHGLFHADELQQGTCGAMGACGTSMSSTLVVAASADMDTGCPGGMEDLRARSPTSAGSSPSSPSGSVGSGSSTGGSELGRHFLECTNQAIREEIPEMPPGPPPAKMAPPPPVGPPPDLPLDRADLKRAVEDSASSREGKRLRSVNSCPGNLASEDGDGGGKVSQPGCSTDGESSNSSSCTEEVHNVELDGANNHRMACDTSVETSYSQSPPSARWVWDRFLQKDRQSASTAVLEKRMLQALDSLHC